MDRKRLKKYQMLYMMPYGFCSRSALRLAIRMSNTAFVEYSASISMKDRLAEIVSCNDAVTKQIQRMLSTGYMTDVSRKYGDQDWERIRMYRLTRAGFYLLTGVDDPEVENSRLKETGATSAKHLTLLTYRSSSERAGKFRADWLAATAEANPAPRKKLKQRFTENLGSGEATVLNWGAADARLVSEITGNQNTMQIYRDWRLSNINTLFLINGFLTCLDRRPYDPGRKIHGNYEDAKQGEAAGTLDIPQFVQRTLTSWYQDNPKAYSFLEPLQELNDDNYEKWLTTPAFYATEEIPGFYANENGLGTVPVTGGKNLIKLSFTGVAVGTKNTYVVYHTRPTKTPWSERAEITSATTIHQVLEEIEMPNYHPQGDYIHNAIMVCHTDHQFVSLFTRAKKHMPNAARKESRVGMPYDTVSIVPLNASGALQLRGILQTSPGEFEMYIINKLTKADARFERTQEALYPLTFEGVPVLVAHPMNFQKLYWALEDYLNGQKFYVSCYPGQANFIKKIMPNVEFL